MLHNTNAYATVFTCVCFSEFHTSVWRLSMRDILLSLVRSRFMPRLSSRASRGAHTQRRSLPSKLTGCCCSGRSLPLFFENHLLPDAESALFHVAIRSLCLCSCLALWHSPAPNEAKGAREPVLPPLEFARTYRYIFSDTILFWARTTWPENR